jgi:exopolysaccharide biosynthesis protein
MDPEYFDSYHASQEKHRRCAICQVEHGKLEYVCVVTDGPEENPGGGLNLQEFADFIVTLGVKYAYNLDGGTSTWMVFRNERLNVFGDRKKNAIADIIYFASAWEEE